jgi:hypothetical protein
LGLARDGADAFERAILMRSVLISLVAILCAGVLSVAHAERRMFIIANDADGYGVDRCLASGDKCGAAAANAYCKSHQYAAAASFSKVDRDEITGAIPSSVNGGCRDNKCDDFVAIVCTR